MVRMVAMGLLLLGQTAVKNLEAKDGVYENLDGTKIEALGVCEVGMESIRCWDRKGAPLESVAKRIEAHYLAGNDSDVSFRLGRKNRYPVFRIPGNTSVSFSAANDNYINTVQSRGGEGGSLIWMRVVVDPDAKTIDVFANANRSERLPSVDLPFTVGRTVQYRGSTYEIGESKAIPKAKKATPGFNGNPDPYNGYSGIPAGKLWSVVMGRQGDSPTETAAFEPLDAKGNVIRYVDANGKPVSEVKYLESLNQDPSMRGMNFGRGGVSTKGYVAAAFNASGPTTPAAFVVTTNIAPTELSALRLYTTQQTRVRFSGLPVDPL